MKDSRIEFKRNLLLSNHVIFEIETLIDNYNISDDVKVKLEKVLGCLDEIRSDIVEGK